MTSLLVSSVLLSIASVIPVEGSPVKRAESFANSSSAESTKAAAKETSTTKKTSAAATHASATSSSAAAKNSSAVVSSSAPDGITQPATMVSSTLPPTISPTSSVASSTATPAADNSSGGISSAAIGGIAAMAVIVVIGAGAFFMLRRKRQRNQTQKRNTTMSVDPFTMGFGSNQPPPPAHYQQQPMQSHAMTDTSFAQPPPMLSQPAPMPPAAPVEAESPPLGTYTVISTYTPTLGDELEIHPGDRVEILVEYDDGWVTGRNVSKGGVKGVFPKHCIDYATSPSQHQPAMLDAAGDETGRTKRISSIYGAQ